MFSKRHYEVLAKLISKSKNFEEFETKLADFLQNENERFNRAKFFQYIITLRTSGFGVMKDDS